MTTKAIFSGGPYNQVEDTLQGQPLIHKIQEIFQNDEKGLRYTVISITERQEISMNLNRFHIFMREISSS